MTQPKSRMDLKIPSLDGIRALAVCVVVASHAGHGRTVPGMLGVTAFFFLSGYLITTLMRVEFERYGSVSLRGFYARRAIRILPLMYIALSVCAVAGFAGWVTPPADSGPTRLDAVLAQGSHLANYWPMFVHQPGIAPGTEVLWSLAIEEHFYLVFPLLYLALAYRGVSRGSQAAVFWALCLGCLIWRLALALGSGGRTEDVWRIAAGSDTRFDAMLFGCALAVRGNPALDRSRLRPSLWKYVLFPLGLAVLAATLVVRDPLFRNTLRFTLQGLAMVPLFVVAVRHARWLPIRLLNLGWVRRVGVLSYGVYLFHYLIVQALAEHLPGLGGLGMLASALGLSMLVAWAAYRLVDCPLAAYRQAWGASNMHPRPIHGTPDELHAPRLATEEPGRQGPPRNLRGQGHLAGHVVS